MKKVHAEIEYLEDGNGNSIHSDICPPDCSSEFIKEEEYRKLLHAYLDDWLDNSGGSGVFYIGEQGYDLSGLTISSKNPA